MATPLGHSLLGVTCLLALNTKNKHKIDFQIIALTVIAANFPDFDLLPGLIIGDINVFHQGGSHSLFAALIFGAFCTLLSNYMKISTLRLAIIGFVAYSSHLLLDMFCYDGRAPFGIPLFWPFHDEHFISPATIFSGVRHGVPGDSMQVFISNLLSIHNLKTVLIEALAITPLLMLFLFIGKKEMRAKKTNMGVEN